VRAGRSWLRSVAAALSGGFVTSELRSHAPLVRYGYSLLAGMAFMPSALATTVIAGPLTAPMMRRLGARATCVLGGATMVASLGGVLAALTLVLAFAVRIVFAGAVPTLRG